jgi:hypothetical protein
MELSALETVRREMWESYQVHGGQGCVDLRLLLRWYTMLSREIAARTTDEEGENPDNHAKS